MNSPVRIQLRRTGGWCMPPNTVAVTRPGPWGNPFIVGVHGTRDECVLHYERLLSGFLFIAGKLIVDRSTFVKYLKFAGQHIDELRGKNLACWCSLPADNALDICHAVVLLRRANSDIPNPPMATWV